MHYFTGTLFLKGTLMRLNIFQSATTMVAISLLVGSLFINQRVYAAERSVTAQKLDANTKSLAYPIGYSQEETIKRIWNQDAVKIEDTLCKKWLADWEQSILGSARSRYCDKEMGEEIGWRVSPFLNGFYYGYVATEDTKWIDLFIDWTDSWVKRGIVEPDGYVGWPKVAGASTQSVPDFYTDNLLGEAMGLRPVVMMADAILKDPALKAKYGEKAQEYLNLAERTIQKWNERGCWREVENGGLWVVPVFGINQETGKWTEGYNKRNTDGFSKPANKQNLIAGWLIAMYDVTGKSVYKERAEKWWQLMKSRMRLRGDGKYYAWNYWDPAGPWDYRPTGQSGIGGEALPGISGKMQGIRTESKGLCTTWCIVQHKCG